MNEKTLQEAIDHAIRDYPRESCGLVTIVKGRELYMPCENVASDPLNDFEISGRRYAEVETMGAIMAIVHSHPNSGPRPSQADLVQCEEWGMPWYIIGVNTVNGERACEIERFEPSGYEAPLTGRQWHHGVLDCYSLCRDWYKRERGIELPNMHREDDWWDKGQNLYEEHFREFGFEVVARKEGPRIDMADLQPGDALLMQVQAPVINHAAIYLGDERILHHRMDRLSSNDPFSGYYQECTRLIVRYKG